MAVDDQLTTVTVYTADRMKAIEDSSVVSGTVNGSGHLILTKHDGTPIDAGSVTGPQGNPGPTGAGTIAGEIKMYGSATIPSGYLQCNGQAVSRTTYATLFGIIGTTFGTGNGTTTFNVPNLTSKFPRGGTVGSTGGADSHTHTQAAHTHDAGGLAAQIRMSTSDNSLQGKTVTLPSYTVDTSMTTSANGTASTSRTNGVAVTGTTASTTPPDSGSSSNVPAYLGLVFIIKT